MKLLCEWMSKVFLTSTLQDQISEASVCVYCISPMMALALVLVCPLLSPTHCWFPSL